MIYNMNYAKSKPLVLAYVKYPKIRIRCIHINIYPYFNIGFSGLSHISFFFQVINRHIKYAPNLALTLQHVLCPQNQILNYNMHYVPKLQVICCHTIILLLPNHKPSYIVYLDLDLKLQHMPFS